jgi:hypothetical protein
MTFNIRVTEQLVAPSKETNARILAGECFCRAVRYEVADQFAYALNCHCSNCRRTTGSAFKPFAGISRDKFTIVKGADSLLIFGDEAAHDAHCGRCGSLLYSVVPRRRFRSRRHGHPDRRSLDPAGRPHLRGIEGALVHAYRRPAAICGARHRTETRRENLTARDEPAGRPAD